MLVLYLAELVRAFPDTRFWALGQLVGDANRRSRHDFDSASVTYRRIAWWGPATLCGCWLWSSPEVTSAGFTPFRQIACSRCTRRSHSPVVSTVSTGEGVPVR